MQPVEYTVVTFDSQGRICLSINAVRATPLLVVFDHLIFISHGSPTNIDSLKLNSGLVISNL
jgi:hypothetical protein